MANADDDSYEKILVATLVRAHEAVKFAETKNAALLAFSSAWSASIGSLLVKDTSDVSALFSFLATGGCLFLASALVALWSFLPSVALGKFFHGEREISRPLNLLFFGDISVVAIDDISNRMVSRYRPANGEVFTDAYVSDLVCQIHVNSTIASRKYKRFRAATCLALASMAIVSFPALKFIFVNGIRFLVRLAG